MSIELTIKAKHLALEPAIIKHHENKIKKSLRRERQAYNLDLQSFDWKDPIWKRHFDAHAQLWKLQKHRRYDVRLEARATHLARAFLDNMSYKAVEANRKRDIKEDFEFRYIVIPRVIDMVNKYHNRQHHIVVKEDFVNRWNKHLVEKETICKWLDVEPNLVGYKYNRALREYTLKRYQDRNK